MTELEELGLALAEMQLLYETSRRISAAADVDEVIAAYLEHVAVRGRYTCTVVLYEFTEQGEREKVRICGRWSPGEGLSLASAAPARQRRGWTPWEPWLEAAPSSPMWDATSRNARRPQPP